MGKVKAYAKINLGLWVLAEREDRYHEIRTIYHKIALFDEIELQPQDYLTVEATCGPQGSDNICHKAVRLLSEISGYPIKLKVYIRKNIPIGAGLGGGSSDAASVILAINKSLNLNMSHRELLKIGESLGADVPFFLSGFNAAMGIGKGEVLIPINTKLKIPVIIYSPEFSVSTQWAYRKMNEERRFSGFIHSYRLSQMVVQGLEKADLDIMKDGLENDFEKVIFKDHPQLLKVKEKLKGEGAYSVLLSGSGSSIFALFKGKENLSPVGTGKIIKTELLPD